MKYLYIYFLLFPFILISQNTSSDYKFSLYKKGYIQNENDTTIEFYNSLQDFSSKTVKDLGIGSDKKRTQYIYIEGDYGQLEKNYFDSVLKNTLIRKISVDTNYNTPANTHNKYKILAEIKKKKQIIVLDGKNNYEKYFVSINFSIYNSFNQVIKEIPIKHESDFVHWQKPDKSKGKSTTEFKNSIIDLYSNIATFFYYSDEFQKILSTDKTDSLHKAMPETHITLSAKNNNDFDYSDAIVGLQKEADSKKVFSSGCIISQEGHIITLYTNLDEKEKTTILYDNKKYDASVVCHDDKTNLCLLKCDFKPKAFFNISIDKAKLMTTVYTASIIGSNELGGSIGKGVISGNRTFNEIDYYQTDAKMNKGNLGGALINEKGELIGILSASEKNTEAIGFALPSKYLVDRLKIHFK